SRAALARMRRCSATSSSTSPGLRRHLASGLRRQVPLPLQGASTSTRSKPPAWRFIQGSRSLARPRRSTLCAPARLSRVAARSTRPFSTSQATSLPLLAMAAASARVLPPAPAQKSTTRCPGLASVSNATSCEPSSCTSIRPALKQASEASGGRPSTRMPSGESGLGPPPTRPARHAPPPGGRDGPLASRLERIGAQIRRRLAHQRGEPGLEPPAEGGAELRLEPGGELVAHIEWLLRPRQRLALQCLGEPALR